jgi:hypothetical protein
VRASREVILKLPTQLSFAASVQPKIELFGRRNPAQSCRNRHGAKTREQNWKRRGARWAPIVQEQCAKFAL